jgi:hypothetical protein
MNLIFEVETKYGIFKSSLNVKDETSPEEIEQIKTNIVNSWIALIETPVEFNSLEEADPVLQENFDQEDPNNG